MWEIYDIDEQVARCQLQYLQLSSILEDPQRGIGVIVRATLSLPRHVQQQLRDLNWEPGFLAPIPFVGSTTQERAEWLTTVTVLIEHIERQWEASRNTYTGGDNHNVQLSNAEDSQQHQAQQRERPSNCKPEAC